MRKKLVPIDTLSNYLFTDFKRKIIDQINEEIDQSKMNISNEHCFELGSVNNKDSNMHSDNIKSLNLYIEKMQSLKEIIERS